MEGNPSLNGKALVQKELGKGVLPITSEMAVSPKGGITLGANGTRSPIPNET